MDIKNPILKKVLERYDSIARLSEISYLLDWDMNVNLPAKGVESRAKQSAYLTELITQQWQNPAILEPLTELIEAKSQLSDLELAIVRVLDRASQIYRKVPRKLLIQQAEVTSTAFMVWQEAKTSNSFNLFAPHLEKVVSICQQIADHLGFQKNAYDALLNLYDQDLTATTCQSIFDQIQPGLTSLLTKIQSSESYRPGHSLIDSDHWYNQQQQHQLAVFVLHKMGYDFQAGRLDTAMHPFSTEVGHGDTRITTRYLDHDFRSSLSAAMHEGGHALYTQGINPDLAGISLEDELSFAIHESQSRFWENQIGRSPQFLHFITPVLQSTYPEYLGQSSSDDMVKLFNMVDNSPIRIEADEVSYCLHIMVRFELENDLINQTLKVQDLPQAWNDKMKKYLNIKVKDDQHGVLQDVHWSNGYIGYFPSYALGNLYAAQFTNAMSKTVDLDQLVSQGNLSPILAWLRENIHQYGSRYTADELVNRVTGQSLNPQFYLEYLDQKYSQIYHLKKNPAK